MRNAPEPPQTATRSMGFPRKAVCFNIGTRKVSLTLAKKAPSSMGFDKDPIAPAPTPLNLFTSG